MRFAFPPYGPGRYPARCPGLGRYGILCGLWPP